MEPASTLWSPATPRARLHPPRERETIAALRELSDTAAEGERSRELVAALPGTVNALFAVLVSTSAQRPQQETNLSDGHYSRPPEMWSLELRVRGGFHDISSLEKKPMLLGWSQRFGSMAACAKQTTLLYNLEAHELTN